MTSMRMVQHGREQACAHAHPSADTMRMVLSLLHAALLLVPTRELALQTAQVAKELGKYLGVDVVVTTGGTSLKDDIMRFHGSVHIVVATPGRILDLAQKGVAKLNTCRILVMDEVRSRRGGLRVSANVCMAAGWQADRRLLGWRSLD